MSSETTANQPFSFVDSEHEVLKLWKEGDVFKKTLDKTKDGEPYIFYDGPPFATGLPHHGHRVGSILKEIIPRYFTMTGRFVERRFGWDCHGLPIEHEIDKKLGMSAQDAVAATRFHHQLPATFVIRHDPGREIGEAVTRRLVAMDYTVQPNSWGPLGDVMLIAVDEAGNIDAAADPRGRGLAEIFEVTPGSGD